MTVSLKSTPLSDDAAGAGVRNPPLIVVVGPTAAGKSELGLQLCEALGGEVISADSMQVYRGFDIGTGKLAAKERRSIPHHLLDVVDGHDRFSAAQFVELADAAIADIASRDKVVVVVGGTGLYVRALLRGLFDAPPPDPAIRQRHEQQRDEKGLASLYEELQQIDAESARNIDENDFVRISRALEIFEQTGRPVSELRKEHGFREARYPTYVVGLKLEPDTLKARIERRVDAMMQAGWLDEVRRLRRAGYENSHPMGALGYKQLNAHLAGELALDQAIRATKRDTWRFSRRQRNWFSQDSDVVWMAPREALDIERVRAWLDKHVAV
jgi:tRNA dimethylallyltransferase